ncbi:uncharacterized protein M6B38_377045 [Iris pallida]|uniref:DUF7705 domain-containing protein n=1 Tax=Iris pallida TaxID=29817 RepID=A0AAX6GAH2_IRIPA|nr:uncharacterized protein M6B38_377045 [Iris pallida]
MEKKSWLCTILLLASACFATGAATGREGYVSAVGDPGMRRDELRLALESWNFCNEVGREAPSMGSPRVADCFDLKQISPASPVADDDECDEGAYEVIHRVTEHDNKLGVGDPFPGAKNLDNVDLYAAEKEIYLGNKCEVKEEDNSTWQYWMIMLKNGNMDTSASLCPRDGVPVGPFPPEQRFPCFAPGKCMNHPLVLHNYTSFADDDLLRGSFFGTWDIDADLAEGTDNISYYSVTWEKELHEGGWEFHHVLKTSKKYPWLMLYLRSDATEGYSGGYHYPTRGITKNVPESPNFKVRVRLDIKKGGGPKSQFYLMDMGSCWKNNGDPCDGNVTSDVTRYSEMIINPETQAWCKPDQLNNCPPYHTFANGTRVHRTDTSRYPYGAYHMYCCPGNAEHLEEPFNICDQYSNPQPQEILQIVPHPVWGEYGYPTKKGEGWVGDPRTWELDVGGMSNNLYFYQDPGTTPVKRWWPSLDVGTEIYISNEDQVAEWIVSEFDILIPKE